MRQETRKVCQAFIDRKRATAARSTTDGKAIYLHGNAIAWWDDDDADTLFICFCGYSTTTTKERINGLCELLGLGRPFYVKDFQLYFGCELRPVDSRETLRIHLPTARRCRAVGESLIAA